MKQEGIEALENLTANGALFSAFFYYFSWFSLQALVDMKMGVFPALVSGGAMGLCMMITLGSAFSKGCRLGIFLRVVFGLCSMGIGFLMDWAIRKLMAQENSRISRWNRRVSALYLDIFSRKGAGFIVLLTWAITVGVISLCTPGRY